MKLAEWTSSPPDIHKGPGNTSNVRQTGVNSQFFP